MTGVAVLGATMPMDTGPLVDRIGGSDCERILDGFLAQPVNALTSAAYMVSGAVVLARCWQVAADRRPEVLGYAGVLALIGFGSVIYHGPQTAGAKLLHDWPIPVLILIIVVTPLVRWRRGLEPLPGMTPVRVTVVAVLGAAGGLAYLFGRTGSPLCDPDSWLQLHGAWHLATAIAFAVIAEILYRPARAEARVEP